jgi:phosphoglycerol transferase MdoB-like AlkP superfamily enzyme
MDLHLPKIRQYQQHPLGLYATWFGLVFLVVVVIKALFLGKNLDVSNAIFTDFFSSLYFDLIGTFYWSLPVAIILCFPRGRASSTIIKVYTILLIGLFTLLGLIDTLWFEVQQSRLSFASIEMILFESDRFSDYILSYPIWFVLLVVFITIMALGIRKIKFTWQSNWRRTVYLILFLICLGFIFRGGFRLRPYSTSDTTRFVHNQPLIYQSFPLFLLETIRPLQMPEPEWLTKNPILHDHTHLATPNIRPRNVVLIILESFGEEYTQLNHGWGPTYTPQLNNIMERGTVVKPFYASGDQSVDAIPSIFHGLPNWSVQPVIGSWMSHSGPPSLFQQLKSAGIKSHFIHLSDANTMGFQSYLKGIGLDQYWSESEFRSASLSKGPWGIHDEGGFEILNKYLDTVSGAHFTTFYSLSSHHPYATPGGHQNVGSHPIHDAVAYTDSCLGAFVGSVDSLIKKYSNTTFIITADHSSVNQLHAYRTPSGKYAIPCVVLNAPDLQVNGSVFSQQDLHATILSLCLPEKSFFSLGRPFSIQSDDPIIQYDGQQFIVISKAYCLTADFSGPTALFDRIADPNHLVDIRDQFPEKTEELFNHLVRQYSEIRYRIYHRQYE